ncbi:hypothetical protein AAFN84_21975 [Mesorhizobium sp. CAU 1741]
MFPMMRRFDQTVLGRHFPTMMAKTSPPRSNGLFSSTAIGRRPVDDASTFISRDRSVAYQTDVARDGLRQDRATKAGLCQPSWIGAAY